MMKHILFIISLLLFAQFTWATEDVFEDSKVIQKSFKASTDFELEINSKHGNIDIETWDKDSISVTVTISVESQKLERLNKMMDQVDVRFTNHSDYLSINTEWGSSSNGVRVDFMKIFDAQSISVNYKVKVPKNIELELENKFGDITLDNCTGKLKIDLSHGNFTARKITYAKSIKVQYGNIKIREIEKGDIISKFSDVSIDQAGSLNMDLASCDVEIEHIDFLVLKTIGDEIEIEEVGEINFSASLSDIEIEKLNTSINGNIKFGSLDIEEVATSFNGITLNGQNTDIQVDFTPNIAYNYNVHLEKGKSFSIPSDGNSLESDNVFDDIHQYQGLFTTIPIGGKPANVTLNCKASYIRFGIK